MSQNSFSIFRVGALSLPTSVCGCERSMWNLASRVGLQLVLVPIVKVAAWLVFLRPRFTAKASVVAGH